MEQPQREPVPEAISLLHAGAKDGKGNCVLVVTAKVSVRLTGWATSPALPGGEGWRGGLCRPRCCLSEWRLPQMAAAASGYAGAIWNVYDGSDDVGRCYGVRDAAFEVNDADWGVTGGCLVEHATSILF